MYCPCITLFFRFFFRDSTNLAFVCFIPSCYYYYYYYYYYYHHHHHHYCCCCCRNKLNWLELKLSICSIYHPCTCMYLKQILSLYWDWFSQRVPLSPLLSLHLDIATSTLQSLVQLLPELPDCHLLQSFVSACIFQFTLVDRRKRYQIPYMYSDMLRRWSICFFFVQPTVPCKLFFVYVYAC